LNLVNDSRTSNDTALGNRITIVNSTANSLGNWSADKSSYSTIVMVNLVNDSRTSNDTALGARITIVNSTVQSIGNWTGDKSSYATMTLLNLVNDSRTSNDTFLLNTINLVNDSRTSNDTFLLNTINLVNQSRTGNDTLLGQHITGNATSLTTEIANRQNNDTNLDNIKVNRSGDTFTGNIRINSGEIIMNMSGDTGIYFYRENDNIYWSWGRDNTDNSVRLSYNTSGSGLGVGDVIVFEADRDVLIPNGDIGIGTSTPRGIIDVVGNSEIILDRQGTWGAMLVV
jgi:hypothetical protein